MQANSKNLTSPVRPLAAGRGVALICAATLCFGAAAARAQLPIVVSGTPTQLGALTGGGWDGSQEPVGGTFVVGMNGDVLVGDGYTSNFLQITPSGSDTVLATGVGASNAALDSYGNLYFGGNYNANIFKVPYDAAKGSYVGFTTAPTNNCLGSNQDTAPCVFAPSVVAYMSGTLAGSGNAGYAGVAFDAQGNFFFESNTLPATDPNSIFECNLACIASSSATPTLIYKDSNSIGALAIDPWGNIFFVDGNNSTGKVTSLNEIPLTSGTYASTPTVVLAYTNKASYGNGISGLAISTNGTIYFSTNGDGLFAFPNTQSGGPSLSGLYMLSTQGAKGVALDAAGNLYGVPYNGGDVVSMIPVGNFALAATGVGGTATTVAVNVFDNNGSCSPTLKESAVEFGKTSTEFSIAPGSTCGAELGTGNGTFSPAVSLTGAMTAATISFVPTNVGERNASLVVTDTIAGVTGTAALSGVGQNPLATLDPGATTAYSKGFTKPYSVSVDGAGDLFVADEGGSVFEIPANSPAGTAPTALGSGFSEPAATAIDNWGNLYIADFANNDIVEIPNTSTAGGFTAGTQSTFISSTMQFDGKALDKPSGLGFGPNGVLYISDLGNGRVVSYNSITGQTGVAVLGLTDPWGVAVDSSGNLYVANTGGGGVLMQTAAGVQTTLTPSGVSAPWGVAVDASGSLIVSDKATGNIVRIPIISGALTDSSAITVEKNPSSALGIALDVLGDLYTTDSTGASVYAIQRTAVSVNFGVVVDGNTSAPVTVYLENAGNETATLAATAVTQPSNALFTLAAGSTNPCSNGLAGLAGEWCSLTAEFAPITGTAQGQISTSGAFNFSPSGSAAINLTGYAATSTLTPQTITGFAPPNSMDVGQQTTLSATGGGSGNPVTFSIASSSACATCATVNGTTLTAVGVGSVTVVANQAGNTQYAAAAPVSANITIMDATAAGVPALLMNQQNWLQPLPAGGAFAGDSAAGTSFGVNAAGDVLLSTSYGDTVAEYSPTTGNFTTLGSYGKYNNTGGVALDANGNLYIGALYSGIVVKDPYANGSYGAVTDATSGTEPANCTSTSTTECVVAPVSTTAGIGGVSAMTFDASGDMFIATDDQGTAHSLWECTAACLSTGAPTPVMLFQEPTGTSPNQLYIGAIAVDPWGNLFFTDSNFDSAGSNESTYSDLYYLPTSSGTGFGGAKTGFAAAPTLLETLTNSSPGSYDDEIDGVAVTAGGTVYYAYQYDGVYAIPNSQAGGPAIADQYAVSGQGAKVIALDASGDAYFMSYYNGGDTLGEILTTNNLSVPVAQLNGAATTASATIVDNAFGCSKTATIAIASSNSEFSAKAGSTCSGISVGSGTLSAALPPISSYTATLSFSATSAGPQTSNLSLSDTANGGTGSAIVTGIGQETPQSITITGPTTTTYTYTPGLQIQLGATSGVSNNPVTFTVDSKSTGAGTISGATQSGTANTATLTVTTAGTIIIDANELGGLVNGVFYEPAPQVQVTLTVNQAGQTITFTAPQTPVTFASGLTIALVATGGASTEPVVFTVDQTSTGSGTISGSTLTVTGAGTIVLDANQAGNANYSAAAQVQQTIVVNQGSQAITFGATVPPPPIYFIVGGISIQVIATGGGSDLPISFSVDKSSTGAGSFGASTVNGATSTATLSVTAQGNLVIDATQAGNANYTAAPEVQETIVIGTPLPTQSITFNNPGTQVVGTPLTLTATSSAGANFPVSFTSTTTSVCTVAASGTSWAATFVSAGTCSITAMQPGDNATFAAAPPVTQSFAVNAKGMMPALALGFSLPTVTVEPGTVGLTSLTVTSQNNFAGAVSFACSGLPSGYSCTFNPNPLTVPQGAAASTSLEISGGSTTAANVRPDSRPLYPVATLAIAFCLLGFRKRSRFKLFLLLLAGLSGLGMLSACGGSSSAATSKPSSTTATVTVTSSGQAGASSSVTQTAKLTITIE
jgi:hypothetical protein